MTYALVTVKGSYLEPITNSPSTGSVLWFPTTPIVDTSAHVTLTPVSQPIILANGLFTVQLLPTDNVNFGPFAWAFRPMIEGVPNSIQYLNVPLTGMPGGGWWIDQLSTASGY